MTPETIEAGVKKIEAAAGRYRVTHANPCGIAGYYDAGEAKPWRVADDYESQSFRTLREAVAEARRWAKVFAEDAAAEAARAD